MITQTAKYQLPDQGFTVVRWAHDLAAGRGAVVVEADVERFRRPDGALVFDDLSAVKKAGDGALSALRLLLDLEASAVRAWSKDGFARLRKHSAARRVEQLDRRGGVEVAVDWALANGSGRLCVDRLRDALGPRLYRTGGFDEDFFKTELARSLRGRHGG